MSVETSIVHVLRDMIVGRSVDPNYTSIGPRNRMELEISLAAPLRPDLIGRLMIETQEALTAPIENVVQVHWMTAQAEQVYLSIDLLPSNVVRLDDWISQANKGLARLPPAIAAEIVVRIAEAVEQIHRRGPWFGRPRAHGALGPRTIVVDGRGKVHLIGDGLPGLSTLLLAVPDAEIDRDQTPEQVRGEPIDERTDVYALGALYYQLLSYRGYRHRADGDQWVLAAIERRAPDLPGDLPVVRPTLLALLHRALAPLPMARFPSVAAFRQALIADLREACLPATTSEAIAQHVTALGESVRRGPAVLGFSPRQMPSLRPPPLVDEIRGEDLLDDGPDPKGVIDLWISELGHGADRSSPPPVMVDAPHPQLRPAPFVEDLAPIELLPTEDLGRSMDLERPTGSASILTILFLILVAAGVSAAFFLGLLNG